LRWEEIDEFAWHGALCFAQRFAMRVIALDLQAHKMNEVLRSHDNEV
jgi:hypothetical protein